MNPRLTLTSFVILSIQVCTTAQQIDELHLAPNIVHAIDSMCEAQQELYHYPGLAVVIKDKNDQLWMRGYGYSDVENKTAVDPMNDLFRIGSISKTITAVALAKLNERGEINLDVPISTYMPSLPADKGVLTLRQLGGHLAGIRHYNGFEFFSAKQYQNVTDPLEVFIHDTLQFMPGARYGYSTYGWTLISAVMEHAVDKPFLQIIEDEIVDEMQLYNIKADQVDSTRYHRVHFYTYQDSTLKIGAQVNNSNKWAGGGFLSSAKQLADFGNSIVADDFLKPSTLTEFTTTQVDSAGNAIGYGIGFRLAKDKDGRSWIGHSGGSIGGTSMLLMYPEEDLVVVTLINLTEANMDNLAWKIADLVLDAIKQN